MVDQSKTNADRGGVSAHTSEVRQAGLSTPETANREGRLSTPDEVIHQDVPDGQPLSRKLKRSREDADLDQDGLGERNMGERFRKNEDIGLSSTTARDGLARLPTELHVEIGRHLITDDPHETALNLRHFSKQNRFSHTAVTSGRLGEFYACLEEAVFTAAGLSVALGADDGQGLNGEAIAAHGPILEYLSPTRRSALVTAAIDLANPADKAVAIAGLGSGLKHLKPDERREIFIEALSFIDPHNEALTIAGLAAGLEHLEPQQRSRLFNVICDEHGLLPTAEKRSTKADAIVGLCKNLEHLTKGENGQRATLVNVICGPNHPQVLDDPVLKAVAIAEMGARLECLTEGENGQRSAIVAATLALTDLNAKAIAIRGMGQGLKYLQPHERVALVADVRSMPGLHNGSYNDLCAKAGAIAGLGSGLEHLEEERTDLFNEALLLGHPFPEAIAIEGLGMGLEHLTESQDGQRATLVNVICDPKHPQALDDPRAKAIAIRGMGQGLKYLQPHERTALVAETLALPDPEDKARAIVGLAAGLEHLTKGEDGQRSAIVAAALALTDPLAKTDAIRSLGAGLAHLQPTERLALIVGVCDITDPGEKLYAFGGLKAGIEKLWDIQPSRETMRPVEKLKQPMEVDNNARTGVKDQRFDRVEVRPHIDPDARQLRSPRGPSSIGKSSSTAAVTGPDNRPRSRERSR